MKLTRVLTLIALASAPVMVNAQTVLSDFDDFASDSPTFLDTWSSPNQFTQDTTFVTIEPIASGDPKGAGSFLVRRDLDLTLHTEVSVTARQDAGNAVGVFSVVFYNPDGIGGPNSQGSVSVYTFNAADFAGGFATVSIDLSTPSFQDVGFDPSAVNYWEIEGDFSSGPDVADFRMSFENLQLTPVPEPTTWAMLLLGGGLLAWRRLRA